MDARTDPSPRSPQPAPVSILGLHHVTATVDDAQDDLDVFAGTLGLRLVKKTVNFDNPFVYHFYYGDEIGTPGTIWTTFPYKNHGVKPGRIGPGQVTATSFSVPNDSLDFWNDRLTSHGLAFEAATPRFGESGLSVRDRSGLVIELVATARDMRQPWTDAGIPASAAIHGIHSVTLTSRSLANTIDFMTTVLDFTLTGTDAGRTRLTINGDLPGRTFDVLDGYGTQPGVNGLGTVHHVAMTVATPDDQRRMRERLVQLGVMVTPVQDRQYFQSIYFREPGGVLFEIATTTPGFAVDESIAELGRLLKLPPWEEPHRPTIEAGLAAVTAPR